MNQRFRQSLVSRAGCSVRLWLLLAVFCAVTVGAEERAAWSERDSRLANEYLQILVAQPEYGRVLDLLWTLYQKHQATDLLLSNVAAQAEAVKHPSALLVQGHLLRKSGDATAAARLYDAVLMMEPENRHALQARADLAKEASDWQSALTMTKRLIDTAPESDGRLPGWWLDLGTLSLAAGKAEEAAKAWETAAALRKGDIELTRQVAERLLRAGFPEKAASFYETLSEEGDPEVRLSALLDLARVHEHADKFAEADVALRRGLSLLDFRDERYADFFRRRVRLHERFDLLEDLRKQLREQSEAVPTTEQALRDLARFSGLTVDFDEQIRVLRRLVQEVPQADQYRWELVRLLLDHEGAADAARLLDERLRGDGSDLPALVFLRCEADLRQGRLEAAVSRLNKLLDKQGASAEVEKQILVFAQARALDPVIERILRARIGRDPSRAEAVFELAGFFRTRKNSRAADEVLKQFTNSALTDIERQQRLNDAAAFLAAGSDVDSAIILAREAVARPGAGREELLRLADLLAEHGDMEEAAVLLEKAWHHSHSDEDRIDVDERLFSVLLGEHTDDYKPATGAGASFRLPDTFTGNGFASDEPSTRSGAAAAAVTAKVRSMFRLSTELSPEDADSGGEKKTLVPPNTVQFNQRLEAMTDAEAFRAAWWTIRSEMYDEAYALLRRLTLDATGRARDISIEAEKLQLDLALGDENRLLAMRTLRRLAQRDPANRVRYILRQSELLMEAEQQAVATLQSSRWRISGSMPPAASEATSLLERAYREHPDSEPLLSALTQCYMVQRRGAEALKLWKRAVDQAPAGTASTLMTRYAELLHRQNMLPEYIKTEVTITERETDVKRRREGFKRFIERLLWTEQGEELGKEEKRKRLGLVQKALTEQIRRHPFDGFYHEAMALVHEKNGDPAKAFASMKQAYYTSPEVPFSLGQLRDAALEVSDLKAAIYFQKQIAATAPPSELAAESRRLVELLEQTFQIAEADRVRRRLETKFSQNADALDDLAEHYQQTGQDEAERRVYEQVAKVRSWDARYQLRLALKCLRLADEAAAERHLREILERTAPPKPEPKPLPVERLHLPLTDVRKPGAPAPVTEISSLLETSPGLERDELTRLRTFVNLPRPAFMELPEAVALVRLRAIEEIGKLLSKTGGKALQEWRAQWTKSPTDGSAEELWALYYSNAGEPFRKALRAALSSRSDLEAQFSLLWLSVRSHGMEDALQWTMQSGLDPAELELRKRLFVAVVTMLSGLENFRFEEGELAALGASRLVRDAALRDMMRRLQDQQRYAEALELGESLRRHASAYADDYAFPLARIAEAAEQWDLARSYLDEVVQGPVQAGNYSGSYDPYLFSISATTRLARSEQERAETLRTAWEQLQRAPDSALTALRRTAVAGLAGARNQAAESMADFLMTDFLASRQISEMRGMLMPQGSARYDEPLHMRSLWGETREIQASLVQQGLDDVVQQVNDRLEKRWGGMTLSARGGQEFGEWRLTNLLRQMRKSNYPTRLRLLREHLASVDLREEVAVETLGELGGRLETAGMAREAIAIYRLLPSRAPANPEYAQWLIRACETALDVRTGLEFTLQLLLAEPPMKPPQPGNEVLREKHAHFLALDFDLPELHRRGFLPEVSRVLQGRIPDEAPYLRELALLQERLGQREQALTTWDRLRRAYVENAESGLEVDAETALHLGRLLSQQGKREAALEALREVPLTEKTGAIGRDALRLRAELTAQADNWVEFRELMGLAVEHKALEEIAALADLLRNHEQVNEALSFLTQAERSFKEPGDRFRLRLELLKVMAHDSAWTPERGRTQVAALFRAHNRDREVLQQLLAWMKLQARGPNRDLWRKMLRAEARAGTDRPVATMALCAFAKDMPESATADFAEGWAAAREGDRICLEMGAEALLEAGRARWAWQACLVLEELPSLRLDGQKLPLMVRVAHAMGDRLAVRELFAEVVRMPVPGGKRPVEWIEAFEDAGEIGLVRELYQTALARLDATQTMHPELFAAWCRFLIRQHDYEQAEAFLMRYQWALPFQSAPILFELYQGWGKLALLRTELPKFHLPGGVEKEIYFLASQAEGLPPPIPTPAPDAPRQP